ncbi:hypothetical protein [Thermosyntropha sp.]|uniref:hypothetical protein n=1 Tax=Thermosyntropha sp. TaxID=2740820 RepID=UPI0025D9C17C|nr:hypothetical protein [Thermosyntropha sp.]MBO8159633.1 hypothetical protein [Thermosyntropha sp.]
MSFILVLDGSKEGDVSEVIDGIKFVVEPELVDLFGGFTIKSFRSGEVIKLTITPDKQVENGGGCSTCPSCG